MARYLTNTFVISLLATISTVVVCGVMPDGQGHKQKSPIAYHRTHQETHYRNALWPRPIDHVRSLIDDRVTDWDDSGSDGSDSDHTGSDHTMLAQGCSAIPASLCLFHGLLYRTQCPSSGPRIATSQEGARTFVSRLVMQTVFDALESQARSVLFPDPKVFAILGQLEAKVTYEPLQCQGG
ncbi:hypothetical protein KIN20_020049 [Parelaphostrongylus tenuis]|uniref:Uncharacterized protein n=1 Tax=Parelaphostrongylus tenuis TaxID=148309 RepID=A0AAD5QVC8_PARTN|nr:hypothetical protein KIN20_020049 [Parelaphostrongylus tenuis]